MNYPEQQFQVGLVHWLRLTLAPPAQFFTVPNGGLLPGVSKRQRATAGALRKAMGVRSGFPDMCIMWPGGFAGLELKAPRPASVSLDDAQKDWRGYFADCGHPWAVCRSVEEVEAFLRKVGCPLRTSDRVAA